MATSVSTANAQRPTVNFSSDFDQPKPHVSYYEPPVQSRRMPEEENNYNYNYSNNNRNERRRAPEETNKSSRRYDQNQTNSSSRFISDLEDNNNRLNQSQSQYNNLNNTSYIPSRRDHQKSMVQFEPSFTTSSPNINIEDYAPYPARRDRTATIGNDYELRRNKQEPEKQIRRPTGDNYYQDQSRSSQQTYQPRNTKNVNESHIVFGMNQDIGQSPPSKQREKTRSPEREGIAAGRPTNTGYEEKKIGIKSDGYTQKGTTNLLAWTGQDDDNTRSRPNSPDKRMFSQSISYPKKEEPVIGKSFIEKEIIIFSCREK